MNCFSIIVYLMHLTTLFVLTNEFTPKNTFKLSEYCYYEIDFLDKYCRFFCDFKKIFFMPVIKKILKIMYQILFILLMRRLVNIHFSLNIILRKSIQSIVLKCQNYVII
jgi:hypothetical protein